jgi:hypothetical protein
LPWIGEERKERKMSPAFHFEKNNLFFIKRDKPGEKEKNQKITFL